MTEAQFAAFEVDEEVRAVVKGVCDSFDFRKVAIASLYLANPEV